MGQGRKKYRLLQGELDEVGITTFINRVGPKWYEVHVNFEIRKKYKLRLSCNRYLVRLHTKECKKD